ncbi:MAG: PH domain-containing protein [Allosphingosinicella sp.]
MSGAGAVADRRLHPGTVALRFVKEGPSTVLALSAAFAFAAKSGLTGALLLALGLAAALLAAKWLAWHFFRYGVGSAEIVIESGVLHRNRRSIPFERIQDVDIERTFLARLFGLAKVRIETGAGGKDEGLLDSVSLEQAQRLREAVRAWHRGGGETAVEPAKGPAPQPLFAMDVPRLLLFGMFNFSLVYLAGLFALIQTFDRFLPFDPYDPARWMGLAEDYLPERWTVSAGAAVLLIAAVLGSVAGLVRTVARDFGFRLALEGDRFRRERGLLTRSEVVIARRRIQVAQVHGGPLRAAFGWAGLAFQTLGAGTERGGLQSAAPFARREEIAEVLAHVPPLRLPPPPELVPVARGHILRRLVRTGLILMLIAGGLASWRIEALWLLALLPVLAAGSTIGRRFHRYALDGDMLFVEQGVLAQRLWLVPLASVQTLSLRRGPLQRGLGLATLSVDTAGAPVLAGVHIIDLRVEDAQDLVERMTILRYGPSPSLSPYSG